VRGRQGEPEDVSGPGRARRRYDSALRRERAADTKDRIVAAGAGLLHGFPIWNWRALTVPAVAQRAAVAERTVYRYFPSERDLRDAVMARLAEEATVDLEGLRLDRVQEVAARIFQYVSTFPIAPRTPPDPTVAAANARQREALLTAVRQATTRWPAADRTIAAAFLDVLWSPVSFERLVTDWGIEAQDAITGVSWVIGLIQQALETGRRPLA
jgi:AcrR family transcriptional regulator